MWAHASAGHKPFDLNTLAVLLHCDWAVALVLLAASRQQVVETLLKPPPAILAAKAHAREAGQRRAQIAAAKLLV